MNKLLRLFFLIFIAINVILASWYVLHHDLYFYTDVARDFLLFQEITLKKIVLIGPRSSAMGLFHGPLWLYLNYPAYAIGHGNPIVVGWFWIGLFLVFFVESFFIAKKLFDETTAWLYVLFLSVYLIFDSWSLFNPYGALFVMPAFFFFFLRYVQTRKLRYLAGHIVITGLIVQFQIAVGIPLSMLSFAAVTFLAIQKKQFAHILTYGLLGVTLTNFALFDIRHHFLLLHGALRIFSPVSNNAKVTAGALLSDRLRLLTDIEFIRGGSTLLNRLVSLASIIFLTLQMRGKQKVVYGSFLYFYIGYVLLSVSSKNIVLTHQLLPLFPLIFLIFASFTTSSYKKVFLVIFFLVFLSNLSHAIAFVQNADAFVGKDQQSWKFLLNLSKRVYQSGDTNFGYFIYSPDVFGYQPRYAMQYAGTLYPRIHASLFEKQPVTYVVAAPPPPNDPYMTDAWWRTNQIHISEKPQSVITFPNGYTIERFILKKQEIKIPYDPAINPGIFFR